MAEDVENKTAFLVVSPNVDTTLNLNTPYTSLFKLEIKNKKPCSPKDTVTLHYTVFKNNSLMKESSFNKEIGCTSSASTGEFIPLEVGSYTLCGEVLNSSVSFSSGELCTEFEVLDTSSQLCDVSLHLKTIETLFYEFGQSIEFKPELSNK